MKHSTNKQYLHEHFIDDSFDQRVHGLNENIDFYGPFGFIVISSFIATTFTGIEGTFKPNIRRLVPYVDALMGLITIINMVLFFKRENKIKFFKKRRYALFFGLEFSVLAFISLFLIFTERFIDYPLHDTMPYLFPAIYTCIYLLCYNAFLFFTYFAWFRGCDAKKFKETTSKQNEEADEPVIEESFTEGNSIINDDTFAETENIYSNNKFVQWENVKKMKTEKEINRFSLSHAFSWLLAFTVLLFTFNLVALRVPYYEYIVEYANMAFVLIDFFLIYAFLSAQREFKIFKKTIYSLLFGIGQFLMYLLFLGLIVSAPFIDYPLEHFEVIYIIVFTAYIIGYRVFTWYAFEKVLQARLKEIKKSSSNKNVSK